MRLPYRAAASLILNELGTGLAGRGEELNAGDPPRRTRRCKEVDKVLAILADAEQDARRPRASTPTRRSRRWRASARTSRPSSRTRARSPQATAERSDDLEADIERLPAFLRELEPTMRAPRRAVADEMTPVLADLGDVGARRQPLDPRARPVLEGRRSRRSSRSARPARSASPAMTRRAPGRSRTCARFGDRSPSRSARPRRLLLESFKKSRGIERLLDYVFYQVAAINGYD